MYQGKHLNKNKRRRRRNRQKATLIQTGQMTWPIPVLGSLGALMILCGIVMMRRKRKSGNA